MGLSRAYSSPLSSKQACCGATQLAETRAAAPDTRQTGRAMQDAVTSTSHASPNVSGACSCRAADAHRPEDPWAPAHRRSAEHKAATSIWNQPLEHPKRPGSPARQIVHPATRHRQAANGPRRRQRARAPHNALPVYHKPGGPANHTSISRPRLSVDTLGRAKGPGLYARAHAHQPLHLLKHKPADARGGRDLHQVRHHALRAARPPVSAPPDSQPPSEPRTLRACASPHARTQS
jgi:hypothetical protein